MLLVTVNVGFYHSISLVFTNFLYLCLIFILHLTCQSTMTWPNLQFANVHNMHIAYTHVIWGQYLFS